MLRRPARSLHLVVGMGAASLVLVVASCGSDDSAEPAATAADTSAAGTIVSDATTTVAPTTSTTTVPATTVPSTTVPSTTAAPTTAAPTTLAPPTSPPTTLPAFPPLISELTAGADTWAVVLAGSTEFNDPVLLRAQDDAAAAGYAVGFTDCDVGASTAIGMADSGVYTVTVYLSSEADANAAADAFTARGIAATVAVIQPFCLD